MIQNGPWSWENHDTSNDGWCCVYDVNGNVVIDCLDEELARLIAAAPELFETLKVAREGIAYCRRVHPDVQSGTGVPVEAIIDEVLAKAEVSS